jgi:hypothetical protein
MVQLVSHIGADQCFVATFIAFPASFALPQTSSASGKLIDQASHRHYEKTRRFALPEFVEDYYMYVAVDIYSTHFQGSKQETKKHAITTPRRL